MSICLSMPRRRPPEAARRRGPHRTLTKPAGRRARVRQVRVLVIDDDDGLRDGVVVSLRASGLGADGAASVAAARSRLAGHSYDCLVLDRMLPGGDGLQLLGDRAEGPERPPVLVLTARDAVRDRVEGFERGADDYLVKPFAMAELIARVRSLCRRREAIAAVEARRRRPRARHRPAARSAAPACCSR